MLWVSMGRQWRPERLEWHRRLYCNNLCIHKINIKLCILWALTQRKQFRNTNWITNGNDWRSEFPTRKNSNLNGRMNLWWWLIQLALRNPPNLNCLKLMEEKVSGRNRTAIVAVDMVLVKRLTWQWFFTKYVSKTCSETLRSLLWLTLPKIINKSA